MGDVKRGRPLKDGAKRNQVKFLCNDVELEALQEGVEKYGKSQSDIIRRGIELSLMELEEQYQREEEEYWMMMDVYNSEYPDDEECEENN